MFQWGEALRDGTKNGCVQTTTVSPRTLPIGNKYNELMRDARSIQDKFTLQGYDMDELTGSTRFSWKFSAQMHDLPHCRGGSRQQVDQVRIQEKDFLFC